MVKARETGTSPEVASTGNGSQVGSGNEADFMATNTSTLAERKEDAPQTNGVEKTDQYGGGHTVNGMPSQQVSSSFRGSRGGGRGSRSRARVGKANSTRGKVVASSLEWRPQEEDFMQMISLHSTVPHSLPTPEPSVNAFFPPHSTPPQYMSRERYLQLSAHMNNATVCISHAFQLIRHAEVELQLTRQGLHACYEGQGQGNVDQANFKANANTDVTEENADESPPVPVPSNEDRVENDALPESWNNNSIEQIQLQVDPYKIVEPQPHVLVEDDSSISGMPKVGKSSRNRGGSNGGRRKRGGGLSQHSRRKASKTEIFPSNYNFVMARKSVEELRTHYLNIRNSDENVFETGRFMSVKLGDIRDILRETEVELSPNVFSAAKVESCLRQQNEPEPKTPEGSLIEDSDNRNDTDEDSDSDSLFVVSKKQVRKNSKSSLEEIKTDTGRKRKLASSSSEHNEDQIPLWRQLRVDEELSQKLKNRVLKDLKIRSCVKTENHDADTESDASSVETEIILQRPASIHQKIGTVSESTGYNNNPVILKDADDKELFSCSESDADDNKDDESTQKQKTDNVSSSAAENEGNGSERNTKRLKIHIEELKLHKNHTNAELRAANFESVVSLDYDDTESDDGFDENNSDSSRSDERKES